MLLLSDIEDFGTTMRYQNFSWGKTNKRPRKECTVDDKIPASKRRGMRREFAGGNFCAVRFMKKLEQTENRVRRRRRELFYLDAIRVAKNTRARGRKRGGRKEANRRLWIAQRTVQLP